MSLLRKIARAMFGMPEDDETVTVELVYERVGGQGQYTVHFVLDGHLYLWRFADNWKQIAHAKALIAQGAAVGYYSWDQATFTQQLIDAATR
jgi:hypothetical protein